MIPAAISEALDQLDAARKRDPAVMVEASADRLAAVVREHFDGRQQRQTMDALSHAFSSWGFWRQPLDGERVRLGSGYRSVIIEPDGTLSRGDGKPPPDDECTCPGSVRALGHHSHGCPIGPRDGSELDSKPDPATTCDSCGAVTGFDSHCCSACAADYNDRDRQRGLARLNTRRAANGLPALDRFGGGSC
jgi:hypothetical protein